MCIRICLSSDEEKWKTAATGLNHAREAIHPGILGHPRPRHGYLGGGKHHLVDPRARRADWRAGVPHHQGQAVRHRHRVKLRETRASTDRAHACTLVSGYPGRRPGEHARQRGVTAAAPVPPPGRRF